MDLNSIIFTVFALLVLAAVGGTLVGLAVGVRLVVEAIRNHRKEI